MKRRDLIKKAVIGITGLSIPALAMSAGASVRPIIKGGKVTTTYTPRHKPAQSITISGVDQYGNPQSETVHVYRESGSTISEKYYS